MSIFLKQYFRNLRRNLLHSFITIVGFSASIAVIIILMFFIVAETSYDKDFKNIDNTYIVVTTKNESFVEEDAKEILIEKFPQIGLACRYYNWKANFVYNHCDFTGQLVTTDEGFFDVFSVQFVDGNKETAFSNLQGIVITESLAKKVFKDKYPVGQLIKNEYGKEFQVSAIVKDLPKKSSVVANCFIHYKSKIYKSGINDVFTTKLFIVTRVETKLKELEANISKTLNENSKILHNKRIEYGENIEWKLTPFKNAYFDTTIKSDHLQHANIELILIISFISLIILVLAIINYINLSTASIISRVKEIGIRKTNGASKANIFSQFVLESIVTCLLSSSLAFILAIIIIPSFEVILGKQLDFIDFTPLNICLFLSVIFLIGVISGVFPALIASKNSPVRLFNGKFILMKSYFRHGLTTFQFTISTVMIICFILIFKQLTLFKNRDIGFDTACLIKIDYPMGSYKSDVIKEILNKNPNIFNVSFTDGNPMEIGQYSGGNNPIKGIAIMSGDEAFIETFHLKILQGRNICYPSEIQECLITWNAFKESGWDNIDGKIYRDYKVVGVVNSFNNDDLHQLPSNIMITNSSKDFSCANIRLNSGKIPESMDFIKKVWNENFPDYAFRYVFYDQWVETMFNKEKNHARIAIVFGILSIILSCLGLFGLAENSIKQKTKEIGIRKINGAKVSEILTMLNCDFVKWVAIAFIIATPIAWFAMHKWLESFAYKTELSWWIFALAGLLALGIALLTVSWQSWRAATRNPVEALRYE